MTATDTPGPNEGPGVRAEHDELGFTLDEFRQHLDVVGSSLIASLRPVLEHVAIVVRDLAAAFGQAWESMVDAVASVIDLTDAVIEGHVPTYAVRCLGITEVDIKTWTLSEVRMWNGRRIPVDRDQLLDWVLTARQRGQL